MENNVYVSPTTVVIEFATSNEILAGSGERENNLPYFENEDM